MQDSIGRLRWQCRRGMKELDILLSRYVDEQYCAAPSAEKEAFQELLKTQDSVIYAYCLGQETPPGHLVALVERITAHSGTEL